MKHSENTKVAMNGLYGDVQCGTKTKYHNVMGKMIDEIMHLGECNEKYIQANANHQEKIDRFKKATINNTQLFAELTTKVFELSNTDMGQANALLQLDNDMLKKRNDNQCESLDCLTKKNIAAQNEIKELKRRNANQYQTIEVQNKEIVELKLYKHNTINSLENLNATINKQSQAIARRDDNIRDMASQRASLQQKNIKLQNKVYEQRDLLDIKPLTYPAVIDESLLDNQLDESGDTWAKMFQPFINAIVEGVIVKPQEVKPQELTFVKLKPRTNPKSDYHLDMGSELQSQLDVIDKFLNKTKQSPIIVELTPEAKEKYDKVMKKPIIAYFDFPIVAVKKARPLHKADADCIFNSFMRGSFN